MTSSPALASYFSRSFSKEGSALLSEDEDQLSYALPGKPRYVRLIGLFLRHRFGLFNEFELGWFRPQGPARRHRSWTSALPRCNQI